LLLKPISQRKGNIMSFFNKQTPLSGSHSSKQAASTSGPDPKQKEKKGPVGAAPAVHPGPEIEGPHDADTINDEPKGSPARSPKKTAIKRNAASVDSDALPPEKKVRKVS
jgi:hypothetical protein